MCNWNTKETQHRNLLQVAKTNVKLHGRGLVSQDMERAYFHNTGARHTASGSEADVCLFKLCYSFRSSLTFTFTADISCAVTVLCHWCVCSDHVFSTRLSCYEQNGDKSAGNSGLFDVDFASLPRQLQLRLKVCFICQLLLVEIS